MRGQEYKAKDKTVRKMSRDGLREENLHTGGSTRISQRELDVLELSGQERDSVNFQDIHYHRTGGGTGGKTRRRRYVPDSVRSDAGRTEDISLSENFLNSDVEQDGQKTEGRIEESFSESCSYQSSDRAEAQQGTDLHKRVKMQRNIRFQTEPTLQSETQLQMEPESGQDRKFSTEVRQQRRKRQLYENRAFDGKEEDQSLFPVPETFFPEHSENNTALPDFVSEENPLGAETVPAGKLSEHSSKMKQLREDSSESFQCRESSLKTVHDRKKKQVYEYARREKKKKEAEEIQKAASEKEKVRYEKSLTATEQEPLQKDKKKSYSRLSFQDEEKGMVRGNGMGIAGKILFSSLHETAAFLHKRERESEQENTAVESTHKAELAGEGILRNSVRISGIAMKKRRFRRTGAVHTSEYKSRLQFGLPPGESNMSGKPVKETEQAEKRKIRKYQQKQRIKKYYRKAKQRRQTVGETIRSTETVFSEAKRTVAAFFQKQKGMFGVAAVLVLSLVMVSSGLSSCGAVIQGASPAVIGTTYPSTDTDIYAVEAAYAALENALDQQINNMESTHPGYDEYRYQVDEISHNPYHLISYLTVVYQEFTYAQVKDALAELFSEQFRLTVEEIVETRTRTETHTSTDPVTGEVTEHEVEVEYDYYILCISLSNRGFDAVAKSRLTSEQTKLYLAYNLTFGNRNYLFDVNTLPPETGGNAGDPGYEIPEDALSDAAFANMIHEAEKYLGYPYVWGGASPSTSFDCSGFVCWVFTNSGVHNLPRTTAQGIYDQCTPVSASDAKAGDIIFFTGTYNSAGAVSHVGIYCGNGTMIHCGDPISYASINSSYWQSHFYAFGRLQ